MTSVNLKDIAQEALLMVLVSDLVLIVVCFFAYTIVPPESLNLTIMPSIFLVSSPIWVVVIIIITWIYRNYVIWKEIRDEHQKRKPVAIEDGVIHYASGGFERKIE